MGGVRRSHPGPRIGSPRGFHQQDRRGWLDAWRGRRLAHQNGRVELRQPGGSGGCDGRWSDIARRSETEEPDLLWALRGGGGNFGVVTEFEFQLHPVGPILQLGLFLFTPDQGRDMFRFARTYVENVPDNCGVFMAGLNAPPLPFVPEELQQRPVFGLLVVGFEDEANHASLIEPVKQALSPVVELITPIPYVALQQMFDDSAPWGLHNYEKAVYLPELSDAAIEVILEHQSKKVSPLSFVPIFPSGRCLTVRPSTTRPPLAAAATSATWSTFQAPRMSPEEYEAERSWSRSYWAALVEHAAGVGSYVNFMTEYEEDRVRASYRRQIRAAPAAESPLRPRQYLSDECQHPTGHFEMN